jgi:hypothetical protein
MEPQRYFVKASTTTMNDSLQVYTNDVNGVLRYLQDMSIPMYDYSTDGNLTLMANTDGTLLYSSDYYIDLSDCVSVYCKSDNSWGGHAGFRSQYQTSSNGDSLFDCFLYSDGQVMSTAYLEVNNFMITKDSTQKTFKIALRGTRPHFNQSYAKTTTGASTLKRGVSTLTVGSASLSNLIGIDGPDAPLRYICVCCGGGGGGGGTIASDSACGGGGGGTIAAYIHLYKDCDYTLMTGSGGKGASKNVSQGAGNPGASSRITFNPELIPNLAGLRYKGTYKASNEGSLQNVGAGAGLAGKDGSYGPGTGGSTTLYGPNGSTTGSVYKIGSANGGNGGQGDKGGQSGMNGVKGGDVDAVSWIAGLSSDLKSSLAYAKKSGGTCHDGYGGGGGASLLGVGGAGGTPGSSSKAPGKAPASGYGGGGGGATYIFLTHITGGNGANGITYLYY